MKQAILPIKVRQSALKAYFKKSLKHKPSSCEVILPGHHDKIINKEVVFSGHYGPGSVRATVLLFLFFVFFERGRGGVKVKD